MQISIYLAGKISKNDWRHALIKQLNSALIDEKSVNGNQIGICGETNLPIKWPVLNSVIFDKHNYTGPYFIGDDHGCFHGPNTHGTMSYDMYEIGECGNEAISCPVFDAAARYPGKLSPPNAIKRKVLSLCKDAICASDLFFAWIDSADAYGTLAEIGYAHANGVPIFVATPPNLLRTGDLWFAIEMADWSSIGYFDNPERPLLMAVDAVVSRKSQQALLDLVESPIERQFLLTWLTLAPTDLMSIAPQHIIGRYRADFAVTSARVVIEIDGHDYHKTKAQRTADAARERAIRLMGWDVIRFTGSEIYNNAIECVFQAIEIVKSKANGHD